MGVYIKGMEMPRSCFDCDFAYQDQDSEHNVYWTCAVVHDSACMYERREDCPLVPVPPHGDLIDRREAIIDANERAYDYWQTDDVVDDTIDFLNEQPTIIEAEEADK